jgi:hypothetical protein
VTQVAALDDIPDAEVREHVRIKFNGQSGSDAGGLTDDWISLFMQEALDPYAPLPLKHAPPIRFDLILSTGTAARRFFCCLGSVRAKRLVSG